MLLCLDTADNLCVPYHTNTFLGPIYNGFIYSKTTDIIKKNKNQNIQHRSLCLTIHGFTQYLKLRLVSVQVYPDALKPVGE